MNPTHRDHLRRDARFLRRECPAMHPVHVRLCALPEDVLADTNLTGKGARKRFEIRIRPDVGYQFATHLLAHEWAHALAWNPEAHPVLVDHGPEWGLAYSRTYCALMVGDLHHG